MYAQDNYHEPCPDCGSRVVEEVPTDGDVVCKGCGLVREAHVMDERAEWRTFRDESCSGAADPSRVGQPGSAYGEGPADLSLTIGPSAGQSGIGNALKRTHALMTKPMSACERAAHELVEMMDGLNYKQAMRDAAMKMFMDYAEIKSFNTKNKQQVYAAIASLSSAVTGKPGDYRSYRQTADEFMVVDIGSVQSLCMQIPQALDVRRMMVAMAKAGEDAGKEAAAEVVQDQRVYSTALKKRAHVSDFFVHHINPLVNHRIVHTENLHSVHMVAKAIDSAIGSDAACNAVTSLFSGAMVVHAVSLLTGREDKAWIEELGTCMKLGLGTLKRHTNTIKAHLLTTTRMQDLTGEVDHRRQRFSELQQKLLPKNLAAASSQCRLPTAGGKHK
jgi:hypothetical protein